MGCALGTPVSPLTIPQWMKTSQTSDKSPPGAPRKCDISAMPLSGEPRELFTGRDMLSCGPSSPCPLSRFYWETTPISKEERELLNKLETTSPFRGKNLEKLWKRQKNLGSSPARVKEVIWSRLLWLSRYSHLYFACFICRSNEQLVGCLPCLLGS